MFQVFANCPETMGPGEIGQRAQRAEAMGYDGLQVPDAVHDGLLLSAMALDATEHLLVGTGVLLAFPRSPMITAIAAWDLQRMSGGRFELGLGTQVKGNIEKRYSARWDAPVPQLREYIQALRAIFHSFQTGEPLCFEGEHYQLTRLQPFFNPGAIDHPHIPIFAGAVGPAMTKMVGRIADGMITHPTNSAPRYLREVCLPRLEAGFARGERDGANFELLVAPLTATGKDEATMASARETQRGLLGFLFSTPAYWPSLELFGWQDLGQQLLDLTRSGGWQEMPGLISDEVLDTVIPSGTYDSIVEQYRSRFEGLARRVTFPMPEDPADDERAADVIRALRGAC